MTPPVPARGEGGTQVVSSSSRGSLAPPDHHDRGPWRWRTFSCWSARRQGKGTAAAKCSHRYHQTADREHFSHDVTSPGDTHTPRPPSGGQSSLVYRLFQERKQPPALDVDEASRSIRSGGMPAPGEGTLFRASRGQTATTRCRSTMTPRPQIRNVAHRSRSVITARRPSQEGRASPVRSCRWRVVTAASRERESRSRKTA